jgi:ABC-type glycerol-3-phosphate transport system substrate-binding protein
VIRFVLTHWLTLAVLLLLAACGPSDSPSRELHTLRIWCHQGQESENQAMRDIVQSFNEAHREEGLAVQVDFFPDYQYTEKLSIAAAGGDLPDAFDLDGPTVAQFAEAGLLHPLSSFFSREVLNDFAPTILTQGTVNNTLYALGAFDSAMVLYFRKDLFHSAGVTAPPEGESWTWQEFLQACEQVSDHGQSPVALHMDVTADEWFTYAFSPLLWSAGGRLISPDGKRTEGVLNATENVEALRQWNQLFEQGFARRSPVNPDPFGSGEAVMDWTGHWMVRSHLDTFKEDLGIMPLPRSGPRPAAAGGSWCWAMSADTPHPELAARWLDWVLDPENGVQPMVKANGALPARKSAYRFFPEFDHPPLSVFRHLQENAARARPRTPHYPSLTRAFASALRDIAGGAEVQARLNQAAAEVQRILDRSRRPSP